MFGVKESLLIELGTVKLEQAQRYNVKEGSKLMSYDFVLISDDEAKKLREANAMAAMEGLGRKMKLYNALPIPDLD